MVMISDTIVVAGETDKSQTLQYRVPLMAVVVHSLCSNWRG